MDRQKSQLHEAIESAVLASDPNVLGVHDIRTTYWLGFIRISLHASIWQDAKPPEEKTILRNIANALRERFKQQAEVTVQLERTFFCPTRKKP